MSETLEGRAHVAYASAAFHTYTDLFRHTQRCTMVQNSSFPSVKTSLGEDAQETRCLVLPDARRSGRGQSRSGKHRGTVIAGANRRSGSGDRGIPQAVYLVDLASGDVVQLV
jgi:hypothetical protein